jgi:cell wall-associated NlpC family hydrolase
MRWLPRAAGLILTVAVMAAIPVSLMAPAASAAVTHPAAVLSAAESANVAGAALDWAETQAGKPYIYGGTGPDGYDCSGLAQAAYAHAGITLPRTTYEMLASPLLEEIPASQAVRGDLVFFGSGHVEMLTKWADMTFGALNTATPIGWNRWYPGTWQPTAFYRVI